MFGDNLSKQLGSVGSNKRTDRMGMLLLVSPPGYGKTTLMEYLANRLGFIFMKINGPKNPKMTKKYNVNSYPTLVKIEGREHKLFEEERTLKNLKEFLK